VSHIAAPTYFPANVPLPEPGRDDEGFWAATRAHHLCVQQCSACNELRHPPLPTCPRCRSFEYQWRASTGVGSIFTYTIIHRASHPNLASELPYSVVIVELDDLDGIRMMGNLVDWRERGIEIGRRVQVVWDDYVDVTVPRFQTMQNAKV
jgi:uncharacterized OB-fold protein